MTTKLPNSLLQTPGGGGGGIPDAPDDGGRYIRQAEGWADLDPTLDTLQNEIDGKAALEHTHPLADIGFGATGQQIAAAETAAEALAAQGYIDPPEVWTSGLYGPVLVEGVVRLYRYTSAEALGLLEGARVVDGGAAGTDASGSIQLPRAAHISAVRRRAVGDITLTGLSAPMTETSASFLFHFRQDGTGGRKLAVGSAFEFTGSLAVDPAPNAETAFLIYMSGAQLRIHPVQERYETDGGATGTDVSGSITIPFAPWIRTIRRRATGSVTLSGLAPVGRDMTETDQPIIFVFRQDATGNRALTLSGITAVGNVDVSLAANSETRFLIERVGSALKMRKLEG